MDYTTVPQPDYQPAPHMVPAHPHHSQAPHGHPAHHPMNYAVEAPTLAQPLTPQPVIQVLSPRGIEYVFMTLTLFIGAGGLAGALLALVNGEYHFSVLSFPISVLLVTVPIFSWLFLRLKRAELVNPALRTDPSKRRTTQMTQVVTFLITVFTLITFVSLLLAKIADQIDVSLSQLVLNVLVILLIAGGILAYYWHDEHRLY